MNAQQNPQRPDALVQLYREASAQDAGPCTASTAQILAHARAQAAQALAADAGQAATPEDLRSAAKQDTPFRGEAANDRRWWLQALGSLAAIGLVSWLALQHLHEPGAPQLDAPQLDSAPSTAESAPAALPAPAAADMAASPSSAKIHSEVAPMGKAASSSAAGTDPSNARRAPAIAPPPLAERRMEPAPATASAPAQAPAAVPPPMPVPAAAVAPAHSATPAPAKNRAVEDAPALERAAPRSPAAAAVAPGAAPAMPARQALALCGPGLDEQALAEQRRRIEAYDKAVAASLPPPEPTPVCRPRPVHEGEPGQPLDSR